VASSPLLITHSSMKTDHNPNVPFAHLRLDSKVIRFSRELFHLE